VTNHSDLDDRENDGSPRSAQQLRQWPAMSKVAGYSAIERLRNGRAVEIRAIRPDDRDGKLAAVGRTSPDSLYRRFLAEKRYFTEKETFFDFVDHVALVALTEEDSRSAIIAGGRCADPCQAELKVARINSSSQSPFTSPFS
jgi:hypothetical protein